METRDLAVVPKKDLTPDVWKMIMEIAPVMAQSRLFGVPNMEASAAIMLKGYELGLSLTASFEFIQVIEGKPSLSPRGALALIQQSPNFGSLEIKDITDANGAPYACRVTMTRRNGGHYTAEFNLDDAKRAGLVKPNGAWEKYPGNMLRWRAIGYAADVVFPDVIGGMKRVDELGGPITPEGDFIIPEWHEVEEVAPPIPNYGLTLAKLMELAASDDILATNEGAFPVTPEQINLVAHRLIEAGKLVLPNGASDA